MKFQNLKLIIFFSFLTLYADTGIANAEGEVPLYIKYQYEKATGRKWYDASPERQKEFIEEIRKKREEEKIKESLSNIKKEQLLLSKQVRRDAIKLKKERREQEKVLELAKKQREIERRKFELLLKKQKIEIKMENLRNRQDFGR